jgi:hypothetical protein
MTTKLNQSLNKILPLNEGFTLLTLFLCPSRICYATPFIIAVPVAVTVSLRQVTLVVALRPQTPKHIRGGWSHYIDTSEPVDGGVQLWTTRTIVSVKMDRENSLTLLPEWGSNPIPSDPQSDSNRLRHRPRTQVTVTVSLRQVTFTMK